jgi:nucleoside-diphosphate-sugar epimerase
VWVILGRVSGAEDGPGPGRGSTAGASQGGRVLLTGAGGFIGARTIEPLLAAGYEVHTLSRRPGSHRRVRWHAVDLLDADTTATAVASIAAERLLHLAWYTEHGRFWAAPENLAWVGATLGLLRAFVEAGGARAVVAGTCAEYDWTHAEEPCRELTDDTGQATPTRPATLYGAAKHATHIVARAYAEEAGVSLGWGRVFLLYGPGEDERRLVPQVARALLEGREAATSDGTQIRDLMHVDDVAAAFVALLASGVEGPVNIASGEPVAIRRVLELIGLESGHPELLRRGALPPRPGEPRRLVADVRRLRAEVGFEPAIALEPGIAAAVASLR